MDKRDFRNQAAKKFMENFEEQLNSSLQETHIEERNSQSPNTNDVDGQFNLSELEEAIADIDEYIQTNKTHPPSSTSE